MSNKIYLTKLIISVVLITGLEAMKSNLALGASTFTILDFDVYLVAIWISSNTAVLLLSRTNKSLHKCSQSVTKGGVE